MDEVLNSRLTASEPKPPQDTMAALLKFIRLRRYEPGERLPSERELAERFGVSRNTIRELLSTLEWFRMVERRRSSGIYLSQESTNPSLEALVLTSGVGIDLDKKEVLQSMETRYLLEMESIRLCCERRSEEDLARMRQILKDTATCISENGNIADLDRSFHIAITMGTGNDVLVRVVRPFYLLSGRQRSLYFEDLRRARRSLADHRKLFEAIEDRDSAKALALLREHLGAVERHWNTTLAVE